MIGGNNYIKLKPATNSLLSTLSIACPNLTLYSTGRDSIYSTLASLPSQHIWLPDFLCHSIYEVARQANKQVKFYPVSRQFLAEDNWIPEIKENDIVFIIHYFGIQQSFLLNKLKNSGAVVISDISMMMYNTHSWQQISEQSAFVLGSLRNTFPIADGGFSSSRSHDIVGPTEPASEHFWVPRAAALLSRGGSANRGFMSRENEGLFDQAENWLKQQPAASRKISDCSRGLFQTVSDEDWNEQRIQTHHNQAILATSLSEVISCPQVRPTRTLPDIAVSEFFTFLVENKARDRIKNALAEKKIFCPILWETSFLKQPHEISSQILSIPCDARYNANDMKHIAKQIHALL